MAVLKDNHYDDTQIEMVYDISSSKFFHPQYAAWIAVDLYFKFGDKFPEIHIQSHGQEYFEVENFAKQLKSLAEDKIDAVYFEPMEPDYEITINHSGIGRFEKQNSYSVTAMIDSVAASGGVYSGKGPSLTMDATREELKAFAERILTELYKIKRTLSLDFQ